MLGKGTRNFLRGEPACCEGFLARDTEVDVRKFRVVSEEGKAVPVDFDKGIDVRKIVAEKSKNNLSERRSRTLNEFGDCMYWRVEDEIVVGCLLVDTSVFFLNGPDHRGYSEVFQVGKSREGERKLDVAQVGGHVIQIICRIIRELKEILEGKYCIQSVSIGKCSLWPSELT